jgi:hypothetical protein
LNLGYIFGNALGVRTTKRKMKIMYS